MDNKRLSVSVSLTPAQVEYLDERSSKLGINRSALVSMCIQNYMDAEAMKESMKDIGGLMAEMQKIVKTLETQAK